MDENDLNGTEVLVGIGTTLAGMGIAVHIAVAAIEQGTPKPPENNPSMTSTSHQYNGHTNGTNRQ